MSRGPWLSIFEDGTEFCELLIRELRGRAAPEARTQTVNISVIPRVSQRLLVGWETPTRLPVSSTRVTRIEVFFTKQSRRTRRVSSVFWASLIA
jgi:hypothetical protein